MCGETLLPSAGYSVFASGFVAAAAACTGASLLPGTTE
jgi:hypothetical protein